MPLEHWDPNKKKYVLYRTDAQHDADCERFPYERIPKRVFLDTNVINVLVKHSAQIFDWQSISRNADSKLALNIEALKHVFHVGARANWDILGSQKTLDEISQTSNQVLRDDLSDYALQIINQHIDDEDRRHAADFGRRLVDAPFVAALPDLADRELIGNAIGFGCDTFCTCDEKTIVSKRHQLKQLPLRILTPAEWWAHIKPWAALWC